MEKINASVHIAVFVVADVDVGAVVDVHVGVAAITAAAHVAVAVVVVVAVRLRRESWLDNYLQEQSIHSIILDHWPVFSRSVII